MILQKSNMLIWFATEALIIINITVGIFNIFVETDTELIFSNFFKFQIEIFCYIINVTFDQINASLMDKGIFT